MNEIPEDKFGEGRIVSRPRDKLRASLSQWYRPGTDNFIYERVLKECRASNANLTRLLSSDDVRLLNSTHRSGFDAQSVRTFIEGKAREAESQRDKTKIKWLSTATNTFSQCALSLQNLISPLVPQSPEYAIPYGCMMVIFKILVTKHEKEEKVSRIFEYLQQIMGSLEFADDVFPTDRMREQLAKTYIEVLDLVVHVTEYCVIGRIYKIVDVLTSNAKYDFEKALQKVNDSHDTLRMLMNNASYARQNDMLELLNDQAAVVDYVAEQSLIMASNITSLNSTLESLLLNQSKIQSFQIRAWSDALAASILPTATTIWEELQLWQTREFRLSPKDHWEVNGVLDYLEQWKELTDASILAIFGPTKDRDSWTTEFILDLIQAFEVQNELVLFALCDRPGNEYYTPTIIVETLICQILEQRPSLILAEPDFFNVRVFQRVQHFDQAWRIFEHIIVRLDKVAILIDRVECCQCDPNDSTGQDIIGYLSRLVQKHGKRLSVLITSAERPPEDLPAYLPISVCMVSTWKARSLQSHARDPGSKIEFSVKYRNHNTIIWESSDRGVNGLKRQITFGNNYVWNNNLPGKNFLFRSSRRMEGKLEQRVLQIWDTVF